MTSKHSSKKSSKTGESTADQPAQPSSQFVVMDINHFLPGIVIDLNDLKLDAIGRNILARLKKCGLLPLFTIDQDFHLPAFVDEFFSSAVEMEDSKHPDDHPKFFKSKVMGFDLSFDASDLAHAVGIKKLIGPPDQITKEEIRGLAIKLAGSADILKIQRKDVGEIMYHIGHLVDHALLCKTGNHANFNNTQWMICAAIYLGRRLDWGQIIYDVLKVNILAYKDAADAGETKYRTNSRLISYLMSHTLRIKELFEKNKGFKVPLSTSKDFCRKSMRVNYRNNFGDEMYRSYLLKDPVEEYEPPKYTKRALATLGDRILTAEQIADFEHQLWKASTERAKAKDTAVPSQSTMKGKEKMIYMEPGKKPSQTSQGIKIASDPAAPTRPTSGVSKPAASMKSAAPMKPAAPIKQVPSKPTTKSTSPPPIKHSKPISKPKVVFTASPPSPNTQQISKPSKPISTVPSKPSTVSFKSTLHSAQVSKPAARQGEQSTAKQAKKRSHTPSPVKISKKAKTKPPSPKIHSPEFGSDEDLSISPPKISKNFVLDAQLADMEEVSEEEEAVEASEEGTEDENGETEEDGEEEGATDKEENEEVEVEEVDTAPMDDREGSEPEAAAPITKPIDKGLVDESSSEEEHESSTASEKSAAKSASADDMNVGDEVPKFDTFVETVEIADDDVQIHSPVADPAADATADAPPSTAPPAAESISELLAAVKLLTQMQADTQSQVESLVSSMVALREEVIELKSDQAALKRDVTALPSEMISTIKGESVAITKAVKDILSGHTSSSTAAPPPTADLTLAALHDALRKQTDHISTSVVKGVEGASKELSKAMSNDKMELKEEFKKMKTSLKEEIIVHSNGALITVAEKINPKIAAMSAAMQVQTNRIEVNNVRIENQSTKIDLLSNRVNTVMNRLNRQNINQAFQEAFQPDAGDGNVHTQGEEEEEDGVNAPVMIPGLNLPAYRFPLTASFNEDFIELDDF